MAFYKFESCGFCYLAKILHLCFQIRADKRSSSDKNPHFHLLVFEISIVRKKYNLNFGVLSKQKVDCYQPFISMIRLDLAVNFNFTSVKFHEDYFADIN